MRTEETTAAAVTDKAVYVLILGYLGLFLWFGAEFHYIEMCYSSEYDRYVEKADKLREGTIPRDPYHPLLYPIVTAALAAVVGDTFTAARTISSLATGAVLVLTYLLGMRFFSRKIALAALLALAANSTFVLSGMLTTTDMMFAALALATMYFSLKVGSDERLGDLVALGICFALAYFTRYAAVALIPSIFIALACCPLPSFKDRLRRGFLLAAIVLVLLTPHFALNTHVFGSPFYNENSKNLVRKVFRIDLEITKEAAPPGGIAAVVLHSPGAVLSSTASTARTWIVDGMVAYVAGNREFLTAAIFMAALLAAIYLMVVQIDRKNLLILVYLATYGLMICVTIEPFPRLVLPILPICLLMVFSFIMEKALPDVVAIRNLRMPAYVPAVALFVALLGYGLLPAWSEAALSHPVDELTAAKWIERTAGNNTVVLGSFPFMQRYVGYRYVHLNDDGFLTQPHSRDEYYEQLRKKAREENAAFLIVGRASLGQRPEGLLAGRDIPDFLKPVMIRGAAAVYQVVPGKN
ncbi:MAG: glycosyltransferase family 39 protein [Desulfomonile tiedjei]|nr:glycosyltransferase family 39 protein [Desulfomonile tiedjei]